MINIKCYNENMMDENTFVITDEDSGKIAVIDPGCYPRSMQEYLRSHDKLCYIILTHGHADHLLCLDLVKSDFPDAVVIAEEDEKEMLSDPNLNGSIDIYGRKMSIEADRYVKDGDTINLGETELRFISTPGHSPGGMCIYTSDGVLFSGDTLFLTSIGRTDFYGGSYDKLIHSIKDKLFLLPDDTTVLPGHGPETSIAHEKRYNPFA